MIPVTRLNGSAMALNPSLIERIECTPDTVVTLVDGTKYVVHESTEEIIDRILHFQASVQLMAERMRHELASADGPAPLHVIHGERES